MKSDTEVLSIIANLLEMVLQTRISSNPKYLCRLNAILSQIEVAQLHQHPSDELLYFLIDRNQFQIKSKLIAKSRNIAYQSITIDLHFTIFDKDTSIAETMQIWKITLNQRSATLLQKSDAIRQMMHLIRQAILQLTSQNIFTQLASHKQLSRKYVVDYKINIACNEQTQVKTSLAYSMRNCRARVNQKFEINMLYYLPQVCLAKMSPYGIISSQSKRFGSEETQVDSVTSLKESNSRKYRSVDQPHQAFQFYDSELDLTIISSDSESMSNSPLYQPIVVGQIDEFELLIEDTKNEDQSFLVQNEKYVESWGKLLNVQIRS